MTILLLEAKRSGLKNKSCAEISPEKSRFQAVHPELIRIFEAALKIGLIKSIQGAAT